MPLTGNAILDGLISYAIVILSLSAHEWGHAFTADRLGDDTPRRMGRVTLNPIAHIDLIGTVLVPLIAIFSGFTVIGWAKPVYIDPANLPKTSSRSFVTIAGPAMNLIIALLASIALAFTKHFAPQDTLTLSILFLVVLINVSLMVFNLLPVPPLDGSKFLMYWFNMSELTYHHLARYGWIGLMLIFNIPFTQGWLGQLMDWTLTPFLIIIQSLSTWLA